MGRSTIVAIAAACALGLALDVGLERVVTDGSLRQLLLLSGINVIVAVSLGIVTGLSGQLSIGQAGFVCVGAYASAVVASQLHEALGGGAPTLFRSFLVVPVALAAAVVTASFFGWVVGLPSLRLRGDYLTVVTLGFAEIVRLVIATAPADGTGLLSHLGGQNGYMGPRHAGVPLYAGPFWVVSFATATFLVALALKQSGWGRALRALREDEVAAAAVGVDPTRYKVKAFVLAASGAGLGGGLLALARDGAPIVQPESFGFGYSFDALAMVILGGAGSVSGAAVGGVFVTCTVKAIELLQGTEWLQSIREAAPSFDGNALRMVVYAVVLVTLMVVRPEGLMGDRELFERRLGRGTPNSGGPPGGTAVRGSAGGSKGG